MTETVSRDWEKLHQRAAEVLKGKRGKRVFFFRGVKWRGSRRQPTGCFGDGDDGLMGKGRLLVGQVVTDAPRLGSTSNGPRLGIQCSEVLQREMIWLSFSSGWRPAPESVVSRVSRNFLSIDSRDYEDLTSECRVFWDDWVIPDSGVPREFDLEIGDWGGRGVLALFPEDNIMPLVGLLNCGAAGVARSFVDDESPE